MADSCQPESGDTGVERVDRSALDVYGPAVDAAWAMLRRLDPEDVPAPLARIAQQSGRRLPPPMARRVIEEINENERFRERLAESWDTADPASPIPTLAASALFVLRPEGWEEQLADLREAGEAKAAQREERRQERRIAELEAELAKVQRQAKQAQRESEMAIAEAEHRATAARSAARSGRAGDEAEIAQLKRDKSTLAAQLDSLRAEHEETRERLKAIRRELLRERRLERPAQQPPARSLWSELDPIHRARLLDEVAIAFSPDMVPEEPELPFDVSPLSLPVGVAPDDAAAIDWLLGLERPVTLLVDGYNVTFQLDQDGFATAAQRRRLNEDLGTLRRLAKANHAVVVVYDSDQEGITSETGPGGIEVRFTADGHPADDEILTLATELGGSAVVVSTDRRVREGSENVGALGLWAEALAAWIRK